MRSAASLLTLGVAGLAPAVAFAQVETRTSADLSASLGYSNNPFTVGGGNTDSAFVEAVARPRLDLVGNRSTTSFGGYLSHQEYLRRYDSATSFGGSIGNVARLGERLSTSIRGTYDDAVLGAGQRFLDPIVPSDPSAPVDPIDPSVPPIIGSDIGLFGTRDRRRTLGVNGNASYALSSYDSINAGGFYTRTRYKQFQALGNYDGYGGSLGYNRRLSERVELGLRGSAATYDYEGPQGDANTYTVELTGSFRVRETWTINGALGVTFNDRKDLGQTTRSLSGNLNACRRGERSTMCLTGSRAAVPSGFAGTRLENNVSASYTLQVSQYGRVNASGGYSDSSGDRLGFGNRIKYARASIGYDHRLSERLSLTSSAYYRDVIGGFDGIGTNAGNRPGDYGGRVGVSYRVGRLQ